MHRPPPANGRLTPWGPVPLWYLPSLPPRGHGGLEAAQLCCPVCGTRPCQLWGWTGRGRPCALPAPSPPIRPLLTWKQAPARVASGSFQPGPGSSGHACSLLPAPGAAWPGRHRLWVRDHEGPLGWRTAGFILPPSALWVLPGAAVPWPCRPPVLLAPGPVAGLSAGGVTVQSAPRSSVKACSRGPGCSSTPWGAAEGAR